MRREQVAVTSRGWGYRGLLSRPSPARLLVIRRPGASEAGSPSRSWPGLTRPGNREGSACSPPRRGSPRQTSGLIG